MGFKPQRRKFLGAAAATVGLPFLESYGFSRSARAAECTEPRKRFVAWYKPNGMHMQLWTPTRTGVDFQLPHLLQPFESVRRNLNVVSGLENQMTARPKTPPGNHLGGTGCFLTQVHIHDNDDDPNRTSVDQVIAESLQGCTPLPSLQVGIEGGGSMGTCDNGSCVYARTISWRRNTPMAPLINPRAVFDRLFFGFDPESTIQDAQARRITRTSVLDHVRGEASLLRNRLAVADRHKLDEYLSGIRDLETRIEATQTAVCEPPEMAPELSKDFEVTVHTMIDLMALAIQCDATRVISFMIGNSGSNRNYAFIGADGGYHGSFSHHQGDAQRLDGFKRIGRWNMEQVARLATKLDAIDDGNGQTVLDNSCIYFSNEISDGDRHNHWDLPVLVLGGLGGALKQGGQHVSYVQHEFPRPHVGPKEGRKVGDLYLSFLHGFGIQADTFGENGTAPLQEIMT